MAAGVDYLKEYLIKVGWDFDNNAMKLSADEIKKFISSTVNQINGLKESYSLATKAAISGVFALAGAVTNLLDKQAQLSEQIDKEAKRKWTTPESWRAFSTSLETLGIEYEDLFWTTEEELNKFKELYAFSKSLEVPKGIDETLRTVRSIRQEFNKFTILVQYFFRAVTYYIGENTKSELIYWRDTLRSFVNFLASKMPDAARILARALSLVLNFISAIGRLSIRVFKPIVEWITRIPSEIKLIGATIGLVLLGPLGKVIAALTMIMLLVEDYMYWKAGKHSAFDWGYLDTKAGEFGDTFNNIKKDLSDIWEKSKDVRKSIKDIIDKLKEPVEFIFFGTLKDILDGIEDTLKNIVGLIDVITGKKSLTDFVKDIYKNALDLPEGGLLDTVRDQALEKAKRDPLLGRFFNKEEKDEKKQSNIYEQTNNAPKDSRDKKDIIDTLKGFFIKISSYNEKSNGIQISINDENAARSSGISVNSNTEKGTRNSNITIDSHDTFNVSSPEEANSIIGESTRRIVNALNNELSPVLR